MGIRAFLRRGRKLSWRTILLLAFAGTVACFVLSDLVSDRNVGEMRAHSASVSRNALPSVLHLSNLQAEVGNVQREIANELDGKAPSEEALDSPLRAIEAESAAYRPLVFFSGETEAWEQAERALAEFRIALAHVRSRLEKGDLAGARRLAEAELRPTTTRVHAEMHELIGINAVIGETEAREVDAARARTAAVTLAFDALSVVVALFSVGAALRTIRRYSALMEARATELEQFASRAAHDLRGPLGPVILALEGTAVAKSKDEVARYAKLGLRNVDRVRQIVDDLFAFAQSGAKPNLQSRASVREVMAGVFAEVEPLAHEREITVRVDPPGADNAVACSPGILASILSNLVGNAIKYMGPGKERWIALHAETTDHRVRIVVEDTGAGFPSGMASKIFEPYVRASSTERGLGLGLATVKRFTEAHGGEAGARARAGGGSVFWVELPMARGALDGRG